MTIRCNCGSPPRLPEVITSAGGPSGSRGGPSSLTSILPLYLEAEFRVDERTFGLFLTYFGVLSIVMRIVLLGPIVDRIGERWTMRAGCLTLVGAFLLYPAAPNLWVLAIAVMPLVPIGTALLFPSTTSLISASTPKHELGVTMGVAQTFAGIARVIAPLFATKVFQDFGHGWPFVASAAIVLFVGLLAIRVEPSPDEPAADPAPAGTSAG